MSRPAGIRFGTPQWAEAFAAQVAQSSEYRNAAAAWGKGFDGSILLVFEADANRAGVERLRLALAEGRCDGAAFLAPGDSSRAAFELQAPFGLWREVLDGRTLAATAILTGRLRVVGEKLTLLRHTAAHRALLHCAASVETIW